MTAHTTNRRAASAGRTMLAAIIIVLAPRLMPPALADDAATLCGTPYADPAAIEERLKAAQVPEVFRDKQYVAYQDKDTMTLWTFTLPGHAAHPTVVCRRPVRKGDTITLDMGINCKSGDKPCLDITSAFKELNLQMQSAIENGEQPQK